MDENYFMDYGDAQEEMLKAAAKRWIKYSEDNEITLNPWDDEGFFEIPTYLRESAIRELQQERIYF